MIYLILGQAIMHPALALPRHAFPNDTAPAFSHGTTEHDANGRGGPPPWDELQVIQGFLFGALGLAVALLSLGITWCLYVTKKRKRHSAPPPGNSNNSWPRPYSMANSAGAIGPSKGDHHSPAETSLGRELWRSKSWPGSAARASLEGSLRLQDMMTGQMAWSDNQTRTCSSDSTWHCRR